MALILTGALGNIIDSVFYGVIFNESTHSQIASFMPEGGGYSTWFYGKVVDMFYFPIIDNKLAYMDAVCRWRAFLYSLVRILILQMLLSVAVSLPYYLFYSKYLNESYHSLDKDKRKLTDHEK